MYYTLYNQPINETNKIQYTLCSQKNKSLIMSSNDNNVKKITPDDYIKRNIESRISITIPEKPTKKTMIWGEPTWYVIHTLAHKVKKEDFDFICKELLQLFYNICTNLPCPDCAGHATTYLNNINFSSIQTKEQLKHVFYNFHNSINKRKNYELFPYEDLDEKYSKANTINIINNFLYYFQDKSTSNKMIATEMYRSRIILRIKEWLSKNINHFDL